MPRPAHTATRDRAGGSPVLVWALAAAAGGGAAVAGCHPTGTPIVDPLYAGVLGAAVTLAAARAARGTLLWLAGVATALSRGVLDAPAAAALLTAFAGAFPRRPSRVLGALAGAVAIQVVLRWPSRGFQGATALAAFAAVTPCLVSGAARLPRRARRWLWGSVLGLGVLAAVATAPLAAGALASHARINNGIAAGESALHSVSNGQASSATQLLTTATADFSAAAHDLGAWWTVGVRLVPVVAQQRQAVTRAVDVARDVTVTARQQAAHIDFASLQYQAGGVNLGQVRALQGPLQLLDDRLTEGGRRLAAVRSDWLLQPVASRLRLLETQLTKAQSSASLADEAVTAAPSLLGGNGTRHYFVAFIDPSESRGLGGLIASYGELTARDGRVVLSASGDIGDLNQELAARGGGHLSGPADYLARYGQFQPQQLFQDVTYAPDLPTVTDVVGQLYTQAGHPPIDGVLVLDPRSLAALLSFTGPIDAPGLGRLGASNAAAVLTTGQYALFTGANQETERSNALQSAVGLAFQRLAAGSLPGPSNLADVLSPDVRRGDLLFWSVHPSDQPLLQRVGLAGTFPAAGTGDLLSVVTQNATNDKLDAYLQRSVTDRVTYDPSSGQVSAVVTIGLHNEAPASGLPDAVIGSYPGSGLPPGTNQTWLTVYSPLQLVGAEPLALSATAELGVEAYSGYVQIPPEGTVTVTVRLSGRIAGGPSYRLVLHQQPMVLADQVAVRVTGGGGWRPLGPAAWTPGPAATTAQSWRWRRTG